MEFPLSSSHNACICEHPNRTPVSAMSQHLLYRISSLKQPSLETGHSRLVVKFLQILLRHLGRLPNQRQKRIMHLVCQITSLQAPLPLLKCPS